MKHPEHVFPMLREILQTGTMRQLARLLGVSGSRISQSISHDNRKPPSAETIENILKLLNDRFPSSSFMAADLELEPEQFLARFPRDQIKYEKAAEAGRIQVDAQVNPRLRLLFGNYIRFYVCDDPANPPNHMIAIDQFVFSAGKNPDEAAVIQTTNEFSGGKPTGFARLHGGQTLLIELTFPSPQYSPALFLASYPQSDQFAAFVAASLDVRFESVAVVARPMVFVRVPKLAPEIEFTFGSETRLFRAAKSVLDRCVILNAEKCEIVPRPELLPEDLTEWRQAFKEVRQGAATQRLPA
jgi:transcriptional regulator with XRE-family HTH domain